MGHRSAREELAFGSDSFLDVICNIVGILIILIVIVSVKVERQPRAQAETLKDGSPPPVTIPNREAEFSQRQMELDEKKQQHRRAALRLQELSAQKKSLEREYLLVQGEMEMLQLQMAEQTAAVQQQESAISASEQEAEKLRAENNRLFNILAGKEKVLKNAITTLQQEESAASAAEETLRRSIVETTRLQELLDDTPQPSDDRPRIVHRIMPVSRKTDGEELMFRLSEGKVSEVPIQELMKLAVERIKKRISLIQRVGRLEDVVGPVGGYKMTYAIELRAFNSLEYLQYGGDGSRFNSFTQVIVPDDTLVPESISVAVRPGSAFRQKLDTIPADRAVTIVVYEDSFEEFAALREVAHLLQIRVAARPLPVGTNITISTNGSASRAQ